MRAVVVHEFGPLEQHRVEAIPSPEPRPDEVRIAAKAIDVNYPDELVITGKYQIKPPLPFVPGKALAGIVDAVGANVGEFKLGDRVAAQVEYGAFAEQVIAPAVNTHHLPDAVSFDHAAAMGLVYQTAYFALLDRGQLQAGERVLVTGAAGGVGLASVQLAKAMGGTVLAGVRHDYQIETVKANGADHVIDLGAENLRDSLREQIRAATDGYGVDIVIDPVGGEVFDASLRALAWRGRLVVIGFAAGAIPTVKANYLLVKNIAVTGLQWSDYRDRDAAWTRRAQQAIYDYCQQGTLRPHVQAAYVLEQFDEALAEVIAGKVVGKVILKLK